MFNEPTGSGHSAILAADNGSDLIIGGFLDPVTLEDGIYIPFHCSAGLSLE